MVTHQVDMAAKQLLKVLPGLYVVEELGRHTDKQVNVAALMMLITRHRAEQAHGSDAKPLMQLQRVASYEIDVILSTSHNNMLFANLRNYFGNYKTFRA